MKRSNWLKSREGKERTCGHVDSKKNFVKEWNLCTNDTSHFPCPRVNTKPPRGINFLKSLAPVQCVLYPEVPL